MFSGMINHGSLSGSLIDGIIMKKKKRLPVSLVNMDGVFFPLVFLFQECLLL